MNKLRISKCLLVACAIALVGLGPNSAPLQTPSPGPTAASTPAAVTAADSSGAAQAGTRTVSAKITDAKHTLRRANVRPQVATESATILMSDVKLDQWVHLRETSTVKSRYPDGHEMRNASAGTLDSCSAKATEAIYSAKLGSFAFRPGRGRSVADDLVTELITDCTMCSLTVRVTGGVQDGDDEFSAELWLFDGCPAGAEAGQEIPGTFLQFSDLEDDAGQFHDLILDYTDRGICDDGASCSVSQQNCTGGTCADQSPCDTAGPPCADGAECISSGFVCVPNPLPIPSTVWLRLRFNTDEAAVISGSPPTRGFSLDGYDDPKFSCTASFGGWPAFPHATFFAEILAPTTCETCPPGSVCTENPDGGFCTCEPVPEACCFEDFSCQNLPPDQCRGSDGVPRGPGTACLGSADCTPPLGVCCADGDCLGTMTESECTDADGQWTFGGDCTLCKRACCIDGICSGDAVRSECLVVGGVTHPNASCGEDPNLPSPVCDQPDCGFDNGPPLDDFGAPASQYAPDVPFGPGAADDLVLHSKGGGSCRITKLTAWTMHFNQPVGVVVDPNVDYRGVNVTLYADAQDKGPAGQPEDDGTHTALIGGGVVHSMTVPMTAITATQLDPGCVPSAWQLSMSVDLLIPADNKYWLEVQPIMENGSFGQTAIALSQTSHGHNAQQIFPAAGLVNWTEIGGNSSLCAEGPPAGTHRDLAFKMSGTEVIPCDQGPFPECGGACPPGKICSANDVAGDSCVCVPDVVDCGRSQAPVCNGLCPNPTQICTQPSGATACVCLELVVACEQSEFPVCDGECPPDMVCAESSDDGLCACQSVTEACCLSEGECVDISPDDCRTENGVPRGPKTNCELPADLDGDGGVSHSDWALFAACMDGPAAPAGSGCARADLNCDGVVDLRDAWIFQILFGR